MDLSFYKLFWDRIDLHDDVVFTLCQTQIATRHRLIAIPVYIQEKHVMIVHA